MITNTILLDDIEFNDLIEKIVDTAVSIADGYDAKILAAYSYAVDEEFLSCEKDLADIFVR